MSGGNGHGAPLLRAESLTKAYGGRRVVDQVTIEVQAGEVVGLLGPNGAGKTTTFYMMVGLTRPDAGAVFLNGTDVTRLPMYERARRGIGVLITDHNVRETLGICDRAYILNEGAVLEEGAPARIAESPLAREIYLGEKFRL